MDVLLGIGGKALVGGGAGGGPSASMDILLLKFRNCGLTRESILKCCDDLAIDLSGRWERYLGLSGSEVPAWAEKLDLLARGSRVSDSLLSPPPYVPNEEDDRGPSRRWAVRWDCEEMRLLSSSMMSEQAEGRRGRGGGFSLDFGGLFSIDGCEGWTGELSSSSDLSLSIHKCDGGEVDRASGVLDNVLWALFFLAWLIGEDAGEG